MYIIFLAILSLAPTAPFDEALTKTAGLYDCDAPCVDFAEHLRSWYDGARELRELATTCSESDWPAMRERLEAALNQANRGIWHAALDALLARKGAEAADILIAQLDDPDATRAALAAKHLARLGRGMSAADRAQAAAVLAGAILDLSRSTDRDKFLVALGNMGDFGATHLLDIVADPIVAELVRSSLPHALACTGDESVLPALLALHDGARSDDERVASVLSLGLFVRRSRDAGTHADEVVDAVRADFIHHPSAQVAAAAALALVRSGEASEATDAERIFKLAEDPAARQDALRAILELRLPLDPENRITIQDYSTDAESTSVIRKIAMSLLRGQE